MRSALALTLVAALAGCAALERREADRRFAAGEWAEAAQRYARLAARDPRDAHSRARRDEARARLLAAGLDQVVRLQQAGQLVPATRELLAALALQAELGGAARLETRVDETGAALAAAITRFVTDGADRAPAAARARLAWYRPLLAHPRFHALGERLAAALDQGAAAACARWQARGAERPHFVLLLAEHCVRLRQSVALPPPPAEGRRALVLDGLPEGVPPEAAGPLRRALVQRFGQTPFFDARATRSLPARLGGRHHVHFERAPKVVPVPWTEQVAYTATEQYMESYTEMQMRTETVTRFRTETYSYSCGYGSTARTCTGTRSVPYTETQTRTVPVTRQRPAYRTVTRYRTESRVFQLSAIEVRGVYHTDLSLTLDVGDGDPPLVVRVGEHDSVADLEHDVTFLPARVSPHRAVLPSPQGWLERGVTALGDRLVALLAERWQKRFCGVDQPSAEDAARCRRGGGSLGPAERAALAAEVGDDLPFLLGEAKDGAGGAQP